MLSFLNILVNSPAHTNYVTIRGLRSLALYHLILRWLALLHSLLEILTQLICVIKLILLKVSTLARIKRGMRGIVVKLVISFGVSWQQKIVCFVSDTWFRVKSWVNFLRGGINTVVPRGGLPAGLVKMILVDGLISLHCVVVCLLHGVESGVPLKHVMVMPLWCRIPRLLLSHGAQKLALMVLVTLMVHHWMRWGAHHVPISWQTVKLTRWSILCQKYYKMIK